MTAMTATIAAEGINFGEAPRWNAKEQVMYFSDFFAWNIKKFDPKTNEVSVGLQLPRGQRPSGLGWLPDGRLLFVSMVDRKVMRVEHDGKTISIHADLSDIATFHTNDMVVSPSGVAYVGNFGFDLGGYQMKLLEQEGAVTFDHLKQEKLPRTRAKLALIHPDGKTEVAAEGLDFPNGSVITPDKRTFIVAETMGFRLTAFTIDPATGKLSDRRVWCETEYSPDGICLDEGGGIWVANPFGPTLHRYTRQGQITATITTSQPSFAVALCGDDRKTLVILTAPDAREDMRMESKEAKLEVCRVEWSGAGWQ